MDLLIDNYRGIDIFFNKETDRFTFEFDGGNWNEKQSFTNCKKSIDTFLKLNSGFKPFFIRHKNSGQKLQVTKLRSDGRYMAKNDRGENLQISTWDERNYVLYEESDTAVYDEIKRLEKEVVEAENRVREAYSKLTGAPLTDIIKDTQP